MSRMQQPCALCGDREKDDISPLVVTLTAYKAGEWAAFVDPTEIPGWLRALASIPVPRAEMHAGCAATQMVVRPDVIIGLLDREVRTERMRAVVADQIKARAVSDYRDFIEAEATRLGLLTTEGKDS